jgi:hypothetical protein
LRRSNSARQAQSAKELEGNKTLESGKLDGLLFPGLGCEIAMVLAFSFTQRWACD